MKRQIKFRGYSLDREGWLYGDLARRTYLNEDGTTETWYYINPSDRAEDIRRHKENLFSSAVNPRTIGQFTGLTDKNGKDIYEGDIVEVCRFDYNGSDHHYKAVCEWGVAEFILVATHRVYYEWKVENLCRTERKIKDDDCDKPIISLSEWAVLDKEDLEVIGNIHNNPIEE